MGYEVDRFIHPVDDEFLCSICLGVFEAPVHGPCGHAFCSKCIENWIPVNVNTCPLDKKPLRKSDLVPVCLPFRNFLNRLDIKCEYEGAGCGHVCQISKLPSHVKLCPFNPDGEVVCDVGCGLTFLRREKDDHKCISALQDVVSKQRIEIAELTKKVNNNKRTYDTAFMSRFLDNMNDEDIVRRREQIIQRRRELQRARTPPPSNPRLISQLSSSPRMLTGLSGAASTSMPSSSSATTSNLPNLTSRLRPRSPPMTWSDLRTSFRSRPVVALPDLPDIAVTLNRLTDDDLDFYGITRPWRSTGVSGGPSSSGTVASTDVLRSMICHQSSSGANSNVQPSSSGLDANAGGSPPSAQATNGGQTPSSTSSSSSSSPSSQASTSPSSASSSPTERFNLLSAMLSRGSGCT